jgi:hypothetical protein
MDRGQSREQRLKEQAVVGLHLINSVVSPLQRLESLVTGRHHEVTNL